MRLVTTECTELQWRLRLLHEERIVAVVRIERAGDAKVGQLLLLELRQRRRRLRCWCNVHNLRTTAVVAEAPESVIRIAVVAVDNVEEVADGQLGCLIRYGAGTIMAAEQVVAGERVGVLVVAEFERVVVVDVVESLRAERRRCQCSRYRIECGRRRRTAERIEAAADAARYGAGRDGDNVRWHLLVGRLMRWSTAAEGAVAGGPLINGSYGRAGHETDCRRARIESGHAKQLLLLLLVRLLIDDVCHCIRLSGQMRAVRTIAIAVGHVINGIDAVVRPDVRVGATHDAVGAKLLGTLLPMDAVVGEVSGPEVLVVEEEVG